MFYAVTKLRLNLKFYASTKLKFEKKLTFYALT